MKLIIAEHAGFCFGVKNAMKITEDLIKEQKQAFTLGPIIHNPQEVDRLSKLGIKPIDIEDIKDNGTLIIRTHGVGQPFIKKIKSMGLNIIDATCPIVKKVQETAAELSKRGFLVIIIGEPNHPEVEGIKSSCNGDVRIIENKKDAAKFFTSRPVGIVVQTTQTEENVEQIMHILRSKLNIKAFYDTRCNATRKRQNSAIKVAKKVNKMIVIGGKNSANTNKLAKVCQNVGAKVFHIETAAELKKEYFNEHDIVGITAGASTPDWIIKEVITKMNEFDNELKNEEIEKKGEGEIDYKDTFANIREGSIVEGSVVKINDDEIFVNIGYKSDGIIPINELSNIDFDSPEDIVKVGDKIDVYVKKLEDKNGNVILSKKKADKINAWNYLEDAFKEQKEIEGTVTDVVKGGVLVDIGGIKGFIPASHLDVRYVPDLKVFKGKKVKLNVIELDQQRNRIVLSRKQVLEKELDKLREKTWSTIEEGQVIKGIVRRLTDFGAFVDIGGVDGLIHISDLAWQRIDHPSDVVDVDEEIEVKVLNVDRDRKRISLGLKQLQPNPWDKVDEKYEVGSIIEGKVVKLVDFGAFVEVEPGVEGLVHISQISKEHIPTPEDVLKVGESVKVKIMDINSKDRRMSLSIKEALDEENKKEYKSQNKNNGSITIGDMVGDMLEKKLDIDKDQ